MASTLETKAAALEGLDFIETEEDVKAVEAATLKIQSTFRGKKIRSKITAPKPASAEQQTSGAAKQQEPASGSKSNTDDDAELSKKVAQMQVQDNNNNNNNNIQMDGQHQKAAPRSSLPEDEAERAATKIQAGFKGYKTRKELEGKLPSTGAATGQQEPAD